MDRHNLHATYDLFSIGEMVIDFTPGESEEIFIRNPGGAPANVAIALSLYEKKCAFCGMLGDDDFGAFLHRTLDRYGVDLVCPHKTKQAITTMAFVSLTPEGERSFTFARKPGADMLLNIDDVDLSCIDASRIVHAGSCSLSEQPAASATKYALKAGAEKGKIVSFDINYRSLMWQDNQEAARTRIEELLPYINILKVSEEELFLLGSEAELPALMKRNEIAVVLLTRGDRGSTAFWGDSVFHEPGMPAKVADTNGAGDAFMGAFLFALLEDRLFSIDDLTEEIVSKGLRWGNMAGWLAVQKSGAIPALPTAEQLLTALRAAEIEQKK